MRYAISPPRLGDCSSRFGILQKDPVSIRQGKGEVVPVTPPTGYLLLISVCWLLRLRSSLSICALRKTPLGLRVSNPVRKHNEIYACPLRRIDCQGAPLQAHRKFFRIQLGIDFERVALFAFFHNRIGPRFPAPIIMEL